MAGGGDARRAGSLVTSALETIEAHGFRSLSWPAHLLAADLADGAAGGGSSRTATGGSAGTADEHRRRATCEVHALLRSADPEARRLAVASPWIPN
ncbi:hypothetical protein [Saccharomonospora sp. CUA-673]|uniref:hypothetical protein n=1 Tax=Saccharomonospora sp. CUA-673 TaxID=1904969 RepID=UPI003515F17D